MAKNKFLAAKPGFNNLINCQCESVNDFKAGENKGSDSKRVGDNCRCKIGTSNTPPGQMKIVKAFRVFVTDKPGFV